VKKKTRRFIPRLEFDRVQRIDTVVNISDENEVKILSSTVLITLHDFGTRNTGRIPGT
jgi:hypothetical protein